MLRIRVLTGTKPRKRRAVSLAALAFGAVLFAGTLYYVDIDMALATDPQPPLALWKKLESATPLGFEEGTSFPSSFSHIANQYAAGYYGYMWSEVLALDMLTPFKANKLTTWEGGMRVPLVMRWPGVIRPGTLKTEIFASLDWLPTFVEIAGGPKGNALNEQIMAGNYPGIVKTKLDGVNQFDYLTGKSEKSARDTFFYYTGATPSAVRYKNWKIYFTMEGSTGSSALLGPQQYGWAQVQNIKRDPFEQAVGEEQKSVMSIGGAIASPSTAYQYNWNMLPVVRRAEAAGGLAQPRGAKRAAPRGKTHQRASYARQSDRIGAPRLRWYRPLLV
jgi:hypothetical protein